MSSANKHFKIKIKDHLFSVTLDNSFIAKNVYKNEEYSPEINGMHYHPIYELFVMGDNSITFCEEDKKEEYKNGILIVPPFLKHYAERVSDYRIMLSVKGAELLPDKSVFLPTSFDIYMYAKKIEQCLFKNENLTDEIIESLLKLIFCEIVAVFSQKENKHGVVQESYFEKIERMLFNYPLDITLSDVANELGLSKKQTSRIIKKNYNLTFAELLRERRLSAAASLLLNTNMTISEIVERINFPSESYFYVQFKKFYKITPLNYRRQKVKI